MARGFGGGLVPNMAAFNIKENVDCTLDRVTIHDSEIAFRTRGPTDEHPLGAWVRIANAVVFDVEIGVRYENDIERLAVLGSTFGRDVERPFDEADAASSVIDVRNLLVLSETLPGEMEVYRGLGVREVHVWRDGRIEVNVLRADRYERVARSELFPELDLELLASFLELEDHTEAVRRYRAALRTP